MGFEPYSQFTPADTTEQSSGAVSVGRCELSTSWRWSATVEHVQRGTCSVVQRGLVGVCRAAAVEDIAARPSSSQSSWEHRPHTTGTPRRQTRRRRRRGGRCSQHAGLAADAQSVETSGCRTSYTDRSRTCSLCVLADSRPTTNKQPSIAQVPFFHSKLISR